MKLSVVNSNGTLSRTHICVEIKARTRRLSVWKLWNMPPLECKVACVCSRLVLKMQLTIKFLEGEVILEKHTYLYALMAITRPRNTCMKRVVYKH